jgi:Arc/MetJ family transcription regulator
MAKKSYKFKYVGDPNDQFNGPQVVNQYGYTWTKGEPVTVEIDEDNVADADNLRKLQGSSHFVDMSDKDTMKAVDDQQKALEKKAADEARAAEEQRKRDEKDQQQRDKNAAAASGSVSAENAPRPPGKVTRQPVNDAFGGRTVEQRTRAEDHTSAGKTKS